MIEDIFDSYFIQENKIAWEDIRIFYRNINRPKQLINPTCKALDTETLNGYVKLITDSEGRFLYCNPDEPGPLLQFLCYKGYRDSLNFFFNIQYDFDSIIKSLPEENIKEIVYNDETVFEDYKISYIPKKLFSIAKDKHACTFFDVAQFYEMSLEQAAALYLGKKKNPEELDRA